MAEAEPVKWIWSLFRYCPPSVSLKVWPLISPWTSSFLKGSLRGRSPVSDRQTDRRGPADRGALVPVDHQTLVPAEVAEEASVVQVHDSVLLPSDVDVHWQPAVR